MKAANTVASGDLSGNLPLLSPWLLIEARILCSKIQIAPRYNTLNSVNTVMEPLSTSLPRNKSFPVPTTIHKARIIKVKE